MTSRGPAALQHAAAHWPNVPWVGKTDDDTAPTPPAATAGKRFVLKTCGSPTWDSQNILYMHAPEYNANLKMAQDNFEGNLCLAATGSVNEDVIETAICDGNDKYQAWQLKVIEELPQHLDDETAATRGASPTGPGTIYSPQKQTTNRSSAPGL